MNKYILLVKELTARGVDFSKKYILPRHVGRLGAARKGLRI